MSALRQGRGFLRGLGSRVGFLTDESEWRGLLKKGLYPAAVKCCVMSLMASKGMATVISITRGSLLGTCFLSSSFTRPELSTGMSFTTNRLGAVMVIENGETGAVGSVDIQPEKAPMAIIQTIQTDFKH